MGYFDAKDIFVEEQHTKGISPKVNVLTQFEF